MSAPDWFWNRAIQDGEHARDTQIKHTAIFPGDAPVEPRVLEKSMDISGERGHRLSSRGIILLELSRWPRSPEISIDFSYRWHFYNL